VATSFFDFFSFFDAFLIAMRDLLSADSQISIPALLPAECLGRFELLGLLEFFRRFLGCHVWSLSLEITRSSERHGECNSRANHSRCGTASPDA
jgi:hypothetical protein